MQNYFEAPKATLIYVFRINDKTHRDCLKVGETTIDGDCADVMSLKPDAVVLRKAAHRRIAQYTQTAGIDYELLYTEITLYARGKGIG